MVKIAYSKWEDTSCGHAGPPGNHKLLFFLEILHQWKHAEDDHLHHFWMNQDHT